MIQLKSLNNEILSLGIKDLSPPKYNGIRIENELLDGSYHVQNIGKSRIEYTFEILSNYSKVDKIDVAQVEFEPLKLIIDNEEKIGYIKNPIDWKRFSNSMNKTKKLYVGTIEFRLNGDGSI